LAKVHSNCARAQRCACARFAAGREELAVAHARRRRGLTQVIEHSQAGDAFVMKPDYVGKWRCIETTRKIWIIYGGV